MSAPVPPADPWGADQPPAITGAPGPLPARLARLADVGLSGTSLIGVDPYAQAFPAATELPEVQELMAAGWRPLHDAPLYCLLPAAWPESLRTWLPDRLPQVAMSGSSADYHHRIVPPPDDWSSHDEVRRTAREAGLAEPPAGRIWLLRSPWPAIGMAAVYSVLDASLEYSRTENPAVTVYRRAVHVLTWDGDRALAECPAELRDLITAWAAEGRTGEAAGDLIGRRLGPATVRDALDRTGLDEAGLDPEQARLWRACGLGPADVGPGQHVPPQLLPAGDRYVTVNGRWQLAEWDDLPDPAGTRGRGPRRRAGDPHPWINTG